MEPSPPLLRYRNREIRREDVAQIQEVIDRAEARSREDLSRRLCEAWGWRQANGGWATFACRDLLLRLSERGLVSLPTRERKNPPRTGCNHPELPYDLMPIAWLPVTEPASLRPLTVRPTMAQERFGVRVHFERYHYLGYAAPIGEHLFHAAFLDGELVALLTWAAAAAHVPLREKYIGWDEQRRRHGLHLIANNVRFLVMPWVRVKHLASKVLALSLRRLSRDWQAAHGHPVHLAETFVDTSRFRGTCYRAANWKCLGHTAGRSKRGNQYLHGATPKAVFVYSLHRDAQRLLRGKELPAHVAQVQGAAKRPA
jgi:hypothetical protein